jgi:hypothetical protein
VRLFIRSRCRREILSTEDLGPRLNPNDSVPYIAFMKCCMHYLNAKVSTRASKISDCAVILFHGMDMPHPTRRELGQGKFLSWTALLLSLIITTTFTCQENDEHSLAWGRRCWTENPCVLFNQERERDPLFFRERHKYVGGYHWRGSVYLLDCADGLTIWQTYTLAR